MHRAGGGAFNEQFAAGQKLLLPEGEFNNTDLGEIVGDNAELDALARRLRMAGGRPLAHFFAAIVATVPKTAVENIGQPRVQRLELFGLEGSGFDGVETSAVGAGDGIDILRGAGAAFELVDRDAGLGKLVEMRQRAEILGRHDKTVFNIEFIAGFNIGNAILPATVLETRTAVGGLVVGAEAHVALTGNGDAERTVGKEFDLHEVTGGACNIFLADGVSNGGDLFERQLTREYYDIGIAGVEADGVHIGDIGLHRDVHFEADGAGIFDGGDIGGNDSRDIRGFGSGADFAHGFEFVVVDNHVEREVRAHPAPATDARNTTQVAEAERAGGARAHVELVDPEVDRVRPGTDCRRQRGIGACGRHQLKSGRPVFHEREEDG